MKKILKNILNFFNYEITTKDSWYKRQENYIAEISNEENEILKKIKEFSMCSIPNHWAILQSIKYIASNKIDGDFVEAEMVAYLAMRKLINKPVTFPSTTGVKFPCVGGEVYNFLN